MEKEIKSSDLFEDTNLNDNEKSETSLQDNKNDFTKRRRGRPRKNCNYVVPIKKEKKKNENFFNKENTDLILHLSLKPSDVGLENVKNDVYNTTESIFDKNCIKKSDNDFYEEINNSEISIFKIKKNDCPSENFELAEISDDQESFCDGLTSEMTNNNIFSTETSKICQNKDNLSSIIKEKNKLIKQLREELSFYKQYVTKNETNISEIKLNLVDNSSGKQIIVENTDIACWWCTYNFDNMPFFLPEKIIDDVYHVFGCFCTINCAYSYNININDSRVWERISLLRNLYSEILNKDVKINLAAPKEVLQKYGGNVSIHDYRKSLDTNVKTYRFVVPPLTPIISFIEEKNKCNNINRNNDIKVKRSKPLPNVKNILDNYEN